MKGLARETNKFYPGSDYYNLIGAFNKLRLAVVKFEIIAQSWTTQILAQMLTFDPYVHLSQV